MIPDAAPVRMPIFQGESLNHPSTISGLVDLPLIPFGTNCPTGCLAGELQLARPQEQVIPS
jgi:hypothetical protein